MHTLHAHSLARVARWLVGLWLIADAAADVQIAGVPDHLADNIRAHLSLAPEPCDAPRWRLTQHRKAAKNEATTALNAFGYYQPQIELQFSEQQDCWQLQLQVAPGDRVQLREVQVTVDDLPPDVDSELRALIQEPQLQAGDALLHQDYDNYKSALLDGARAQGYWRASFSEAELAIYPAELAADVRLAFNLGPRFYFGDYRFTDVGLEPQLLRRLAGDVRGEPYTSDAVQKIYSRLQGSDYFRQVLLNPRIDSQGEDQSVPIDVDLAMQSQTSFGAGVGFSSDQGARLRADYRNRFANSRGHKWRVDALWSQALKELGGTYTIPRQDAAREWYDINLGLIHENTVSYDSRALTSRIRAVEALPHDWVLNTSINVRNESYVIGSEAPDRKLLIVPGVGLSWVSAPNEVRQSMGIRLEGDITGSSKYWLSDADYVQLRVKSKVIIPLSTRGRLLLRGELAGTLKDDFIDLPPSVRFFTGGDNSVRGYQYNSLGTMNDQGEVIGGSHLVVGSAEYDYLFLPSWSASLFVDAGNAFDTVLELKRAVGVGLRWYSPVGPLRLDIAHPLDPDNPKDTYRLHLSVGADL